MKKKIFVAILIALLSGVSVKALTNNFGVDSNKFTFGQSSKQQDIQSNFDSEYALSYKIEYNDEKVKEDIEELSKKVTYLLLGSFNAEPETSEEYYNRHEEYLKLRYDPEIPKKDGTFTGLDEDSQEFSDDVVSGISVPGMFLMLNELQVSYSSFGDIRVSIANDMVIAAVSLPNIKIREENKEDPMKYDWRETNLVMYYYFKQKPDGEYKLYYLFGEKTDSLAEYFNEIEGEETKNAMGIAPAYDTSISDIYSYEKLEAVTKEQVQSIYDKNTSSIVMLNAYYNNYSVCSANGFFVQNGILVTTWDFVEKALSKAQYISIKDNQGNNYELDGIITADPSTDIAVLKLKNNSGKPVEIGEADKVEIEDPIFAISSKTGVGLNVLYGIVVSKDGYIQSAMPLSESDEGSPLLNVNGQVVGINTSKSVNTSVSMAVSADALKEVQEKFNNVDFNNIKVISFDKLKEEYYYMKNGNELVQNNVKESVWNKYSKIGDIENTLELSIMKANYKDGILSLRYYNGISDYIGSMQLASGFTQELLNQGYTQTLDSTKKQIYENGKYKVILMDDFNYLIIVMVKL